MVGKTLVGAGFRPELLPLFVNTDGADIDVECTELISNRYFADNGGILNKSELDRLSAIPIILHGLSGNTASVTGPSRSYLEQVRQLADRVDAFAISDHLAFTAASDRSLGHLAPNLFDSELLTATRDHIEVMNEVTGRRICLENLATTVMMSGSTYTPEEYYLRLLDTSADWDCLLDVTNLWINSVNRDVDPEAFITAIPPERLRYLHLAGGTWHNGEMIDSHSAPVHTEVFDLLHVVLDHARPQAIIIERDSDWDGAVEQVRDDLATVRAIVAEHQPDSGESEPIRGVRLDAVAVDA